MRRYNYLEWSILTKEHVKYAWAWKCKHTGIADSVPLAAYDAVTYLLYVEIGEDRNKELIPLLEEMRALDVLGR